MSSNPYPALTAPHSGGGLLSPPTPYSVGDFPAPEQSAQQVQPFQRPYLAPERSLRVRSPKASEQSGQLLQLPPPTPQRPHSGGYPAASEQQGQLLQLPPTPQRPHDGGYPAVSEQQVQLPPTPHRPHDGGYPAASEQRGQWLHSPPKPPKPSSRGNLATLPPQNFSTSKQPYVTSGTESPEPTTQEPTTHTKEQREAISRVLKFHEKNYYRILKLPQSCQAKDIKKSYRELCLAIHPDKNKFSDASKAFKS